MDPALYNLIEPAMVFATLLGTAFGVKLLIWGRGPIKPLRRTGENPALEQRVMELEERLERSDRVIDDQSEQIDDLIERLDFAERLLTRQRAEQPRALNSPDAATPV